MSIQSLPGSDSKKLEQAVKKGSLCSVKMDIKFVGFILIVLSIFERGNALYCAFCRNADCKYSNTTVIAKCSQLTASDTEMLIKQYYPNLKIEPSDKFSCVSAVATIKQDEKEEDFTLKGCITADVELCKQGKPEDKKITNFICKQCKSDKCNSASGLTQSTMFLVTALIFALLSQRSKW